MTTISPESISLGNVGLSLNAISGLIAERLRQEGSSGHFEDFASHMAAEVASLRREGQGALASAIAKLASGETTNG